MSDEALAVFRYIQKRCKDDPNCMTCDFFRNTYGCAFRHNPEEWNMNIIENATKKVGKKFDECIEKQEKKEPWMESDGDADGYPVWDYYCPVCKYAFEEEQPNYCPNCGQRIEWSESESEAKE